MLAGAALLVMAVTSSQLDAEAKERAWCAVNRNDDLGIRASCGDRAWCDRHWNDDKVSRVACGAFRSLANVRLPAPSLTRARLAHLRDLNESEKRAKCGRPCLAFLLEGTKPPAPDWPLLPNGMVHAKLAMRVDLGFRGGGDMIVKIGFAPAGSVISVDSGRWDDSHRWDAPRRRAAARLTDAEVDRILSALDKSHFWQLPSESDRGYANGPLAQIDVSMPNRRHYVIEEVHLSSEAVDLAVLANTITSIVSARWKGI